MTWVKLGPTLGGFQNQVGQIGAQWAAATGDMTTRKVVTLIRKGKEILEGVLQRTSRTEKFGKSIIKEEAQVPCVPTLAQVQKKTPALLQDKWLKYFQQSSTQILAREIRIAAAKQFQSGSSALFRRGFMVGQRRLPLYAFIGLSFSAKCVNSEGNSYHEQDFNFNGVCEEIKNIFQPDYFEDSNSSKAHEFKDFEFGQMIAKGCNAAVYEARIKTSPQETSEDDSIMVIPEPVSISEELTSSTDEFELIENEEIHSFCTGSDISVISEDCNTDSVSSLPDNQTMTGGDFNFAVKMMFNYDAASQSCAILRSMNNEALPAKMADSLNHMEQWENGNRPKKKCRLKPHPHIVDMREVYVDDVHMYTGSMTEFPHALPTRLNPDGFGRNKTMYLVMKRYDMTLRDYLHQQTPSLRESILLLTQLVEAVVHLGNSGVAHRDIKSDNILLDLDLGLPHLVLSDFGCCLADSCHGNMRVPYSTEETSKGGNRSLMAPEVVCTVPGNGVYLDYSQADIWACGALAYEIFGGENPFYRNNSNDRLDSATYRENELPNLPDHVPSVLQAVVKAMLTRDPKKRLTAVEVANILHLLLWMLENWDSEQSSQGHSLCKLKVMRWLMTFSAGVMCERALQRSSFIVTDTILDLRLKELFLSRLDLEEAFRALVWIQNI